MRFRVHLSCNSFRNADNATMKVRTLVPDCQWNSAEFQYIAKQYYASVTICLVYYKQASIALYFTGTLQ